MHKFDVHLLALSKSDEIQISKTEWFEIYREHREEKTGLCICQHTLQHIIYMYNIYTNYTISVGVGCCKKFKIKLNILDKILKRVMSESITKGEYKIINNILEYTTSIELQLLAFLKKESESDDLKTLKELSINIQELIETYNLTYAIPIYEQLKNKINEIEKKQKETQMKKIEKKKKDQIEEKQRKEKIEWGNYHAEQQEQKVKKDAEKIEWGNYHAEQQEQKVKKDAERKAAIEREIEEEYTKKKERMKIENVECDCGIMKKNICRCEVPKNIVIFNNLYCKDCEKWKCRC